MLLLGKNLLVFHCFPRLCFLVDSSVNLRDGYDRERQILELRMIRGLLSLFFFVFFFIFACTELGTSPLVATVVLFSVISIEKHELARSILISSSKNVGS